MVTIDMGESESVETVYQRLQDGIYPLNERGVAFLLGYHLLSDSYVQVSFEFRWTGPLEVSFSPDVDVLCFGEHPVGYEVKGLQGDADQISNQQLYKGIGQAIALLNQPSNANGGVLKETHLALPTCENGLDEYQQTVTEAVRQTPIGLVTVTTGGYQVQVEPAENTVYRPELQENAVKHLKSQATGTDTRHPENGLLSLALELIEDHGDQQLLL
ncbi:MAG: hypothetical protein ABEI76_02625 [Halobacteriales archaeon]